MSFVQYNSSKGINHENRITWKLHVHSLEGFLMTRLFNLEGK